MTTTHERMLEELAAQTQTYARYKLALELIASGAVLSPVELAAAALTPQRGEPTYKWKRAQEERHERAEATRKARREYCIALYNEWLAAGRPAVAKFARTKGKSNTSTHAALYKGERVLKLPFEERHIANAHDARVAKLNERRRLQYEERLKEDKVHWIRVRYFDREESAEALATELGWTMEQMQAFIEAARMDKWVTTTEYNLHLKELHAKYGPAMGPSDDR